MRRRRLASGVGWGGALKRPEYRETGKVGSCENCSAWKDARHAPGGGGGGGGEARVFMLLFAPECPPSALEKTRQLIIHSQLEWGALARNHASNTPAPPKTPRNSGAAFSRDQSH